MRFLVLIVLVASTAAAGPPFATSPRSPYFVPLMKRAAAGGGGQTVTDDFNRANNADVGANWTVTTSELAMEIFSNGVRASTSGNDCSERYSGVTWTDNQSSEAKITAQATASGGEGYGVLVRCASGARTYYGFVINGDGEWEVTKRNAGVKTILASGTTTYSAGAVAKISAIGTTITSTYNGSQVDSRTDSAVTSGAPGIRMSSVQTSGSIDDWTGIDGL